LIFLIFLIPPGLPIISLEREIPPSTREIHGLGGVTPRRTGQGSRGQGAVGGGSHLDGHAVEDDIKVAQPEFNPLAPDLPAIVQGERHGIVS